MIYLYLFGTCFHFIYVFMIIVNNREVREMMGRKSKVISSRFTLADGVEKLASIYHQTN
jgi:hypothetical protein